MKQKLYTLTVTEDQLHLIANCVEDCHRFAAGQMELFNTTAFAEETGELHHRLNDLQPLVTPELMKGASYGWNGGSCPDEHQRKFIAQTYAIYREIVHRLRVLDNRPKGWSVYDSPTLTCEEGGPVPIVELKKD